MNEQITNILNQRITKTSKIQQLLILGLTRRQVADLVTNGNYGFVYNVYKRMIEAGTFHPGNPVITNTPLEIDYTFNRRFDSECTDQEYMYRFADRYHDQSGLVIRADSPDHFLADLLAFGYINVKSEY